jgi:prepilin-type N-terminal cleavage/methylation domain-containing protein
MILNKKISGFTITELLVVMVISSIIMSLSVFVFSQIHRTVITNVKNFTNVNQTFLLLKKLDIDFRNSEEIMLKGEEVVITDFFGNQTLLDIKELFEGQSDTLNPKGYKVNNLCLINEPGTHLIKQISFNLSKLNNDTLHIQFTKDYPSLILLKHSKNHSIEY